MLEYFCVHCLIKKQCPDKQNINKCHCDINENYVGMQNNFQEMNCFANSALQAMFSISSFKNEICSNQPRPLQSSFTKKLLTLQETVNKTLLRKSSSIVDISEIRKELKNYNQTAFEINEQADSMEAFQAILDMMHKEFNQDSSLCGCLSHRYFGINTFDTYSCTCGNEYETEESGFAKNFRVNELITKSSFKYKTEIALKPWTDQELINKSVLFKVKPLTEALKIQISDQKYEKTCEKCSAKFEHVHSKLIRIPEVYTVQLVWSEQYPSLDKNLQVLKSIPIRLNLQELYEVDRPTTHTLRGMIVRFTSHYVYIVRSDDNSWTIINDSFAKKVYTGEFYAVVFFLLICRANPVSLFYEEPHEELFASIDTDNSLWMQFEKQIYIQEIYQTFYLNFESCEWICFHCKSPHLEKFIDFCVICRSQRVTELEKWRCSKCGIENSEEVNLCDSCLTEKFHANVSIFNKICGCPEEIAPGVCKRCDFIEYCSFCDFPLYRGMSIKCIKCQQKLIGVRCECGIIGCRPCCKFCLEKLSKCVRCGNLNFVTDKQCKSCSFEKVGMEICSICRKIGNQKICEECKAIGEVNCVKCGVKVHVGVCFICPICDEELDEGYCEKCDYDVDYKRFVCGDCRDVERCIVCEAGVMLEGEKSCHLCKAVLD